MAITYKDFNSKQATNANKLVDFYEGSQLDHLIYVMDGKCEKNIGKRHSWEERGMVPRVRNVIKSIVDKSAPLFNKPPTLEIWKEGSTAPISDDTLQALLYKADWLEFFNNVDHYTRLLKTTVVLQQKYIPEQATTKGGIYRFNPQADALMLLLLHRGNCVIQLDPTQSVIVELAYITSCANEDGEWTYRLINSTDIVDVLVKDDKESVIDTQPNLDGIVPATIFYDTNKPRAGVWHNIPEDLTSLQEMINLHLTDTEFAVAHQKQKTLFYTGGIVDSGETNSAQMPAAPMGHADPGAYYQDLPALNYNTRSNIGGLGSSAQMTLDQQGNPPMIEFKGPESDLKPLNDLMNDVIRNIAADWSVQIDIEANGSSDSGFKLMVKELPNLQLREKRAQVFSAAVRRMYEVMKVLYPELTDGELLITFAAPSLPVDTNAQEELWSTKIKENRASIVDYHMEVNGLSKEEAIMKVKETLTFNSMISTPPVLPTALPVPTVEESET